MPSDRVEQLQHLEQENFERSTVAAADWQRLLADVAAASSRPGYFGTELARVGPEQAARAYQQLTQAGIRFITRATQLALAHRDDYLLGVLAPGHVLAAAPPPVPLPASGYDPVQWAGWFQLLAAWVVEQRARAAMLYRSLADAAAAGRLAPDAIRSSAQAFLPGRLESYLTEAAGLNAELMSEILDITESCLDAVRAAATAGPTAARVVLNVRGPAAGTASIDLLIENAHDQTANVTCLATPAGGFGLTTAPASMRLGPGESRRLAVHVALPLVPSTGPALAGWITIRGHGATDLVAEVRAEIGQPSPTTP
jgi:hypothetical protein